MRACFIRSQSHLAARGHNVHETYNCVTHHPRTAISVRISGSCTSRTRAPDLDRSATLPLWHSLYGSTKQSLMSPNNRPAAGGHPTSGTRPWTVGWSLGMAVEPNASMPQRPANCSVYIGSHPRYLHPPSTSVYSAALQFQFQFLFPVFLVQRLVRVSFLSFAQHVPQNHAHFGCRLCPTFHSWLCFGG